MAGESSRQRFKRVAPVTAKSMFGGVGLYAQGLFFALIAEDRLYFKVGDSTRPDFERPGREPFRPFGEEHVLDCSSCLTGLLSEHGVAALQMTADALKPEGVLGMRRGTTTSQTQSLRAGFLQPGGAGGEFQFMGDCFFALRE